MNLTVTLRRDPAELGIEARRHGELVALLNAILKQGTTIMATTKELVEVANAAAQGITDVGAEVVKFGPAVDAFEARITELVKQIGNPTTEQQADIDAAVATLRSAGTSAAATLTAAQNALADAADGVDEAALVIPPAPEPAP